MHILLERIQTSSIFLMIALGISSCQFFENQADHDLHYPGGLAGYYATDMLAAPTKPIQFYRAVTAYAFFSVLGDRFATSPDDVNAVLTRMKQVRADLDRLAQTIGPNRCLTTAASCAAPQVTAVAYWEAFELDLPPLEEHMFKLAVASLPDMKSKDVLSDLASGSYLSAMAALASDSGELLLAGHYFAAGYRTSVETVANQITGAGKTNQNVEDAHKVIEAKIAALGVEDYLKSVPINQGAFDMMFAIASRACSDLASRAQPKSDDACQKIGAAAPPIDTAVK